MAKLSLTGDLMDSLLPDEIKSIGTWEKNWAGKWSFLSCTYFGDHLTAKNRLILGDCFDFALFATEGIESVGYFEREDKRRFGKYLVAGLESDPTICDVWSGSLIDSSDKMLDFIKEMKGKLATLEDFHQFNKIFDEYAAYHRAVKVVVDYLSPDQIQKFLSRFAEARVYAEPVFEETEKFMDYFINQLCKRYGDEKELVFCMAKDEFEFYISTGKKPDEEILRSRYDSAVIFAERGEYKIFIGDDAERIKESITKERNSSILKGQSAYPGVAKGRVRIITNAHIKHQFDDGDILVSGMTRPEYFEYVKKSSAFVTDAGGILSHAAITARELKKPCVIGTQVATKVLKDGDMVEVDADKGTVRRIDER